MAHLLDGGQRVRTPPKEPLEHPVEDALAPLGAARITTRCCRRPASGIPRRWQTRESWRSGAHCELPSYLRRKAGLHGSRAIRVNVGLAEHEHDVGP